MSGDRTNELWRFLSGLKPSRCPGNRGKVVLYDGDNLDDLQSYIDRKVAEAIAENNDRWMGAGAES